MHLEWRATWGCSGAENSDSKRLTTAACVFRSLVYDIFKGEGLIR